jgi:hypothetical protein
MGAASSAGTTMTAELRELIDGAQDFRRSAAFGSVEEVLPKIGSDLPDVGTSNLCCACIAGIRLEGTYVRSGGMKITTGCLTVAPLVSQ